MNSFQKAASTSIRFSGKKSLSQIPKQYCRNTSSTVEPDSKSGSAKVVIPNRIERGPTDILKALSNTVKRDYTAPHFKYHDDPFLIPTSTISKRMFALSQESGRKAAYWIRQEHADLFQHRVADPPIEAFFPRAVYDDKAEVDETILQKVIAQHLVSDSLTVYGILEQNGVELSRTTLQNLLELVCYYNGEDPLEEEWIEERWFKQSVKSKEKKMNHWKRSGTAEKIFQKLSPPDASSYSALVCGKAQFGDVEGAYKLYQEASDAGLVLSVNAFNKLIAGASIIKEAHELRWTFVEELLAAMTQQGVSPNLETLNALLEMLSNMSTNSNSPKRSLEIIAEFRGLGIEPSLASYYFLLNIFCSDRSKVKSAILLNILDTLDGKSLEIRDPRDVMFFTEAMNNCRYHLSDVAAAYKLDKLLHTGNNYNMIGDSFKESVYYRNFFGLVCQAGSLQDLMDMYNRLVPNIYVPEPSIMEVIIKTIDMNDAVELLPRLWSDLVLFDHLQRENLICSMLSALQRSQTTDKELTMQLSDVAWAIWNTIENQKDNRSNKYITWTGQMLGEVIEVLLRADRYKDALVIMTSLDKRQHEILGVPSFECLLSFFNHSVAKNEIKNAIWCVQYCSEAGFENLGKLVQTLVDLPQLGENERAELARIVGPDALNHHKATSSS